MLRGKLAHLVSIGYLPVVCEIDTSYKSIRIKTKICVFSEQKFNTVEYLLHEGGFH